MASADLPANGSMQLIVPAVTLEASQAYIIALSLADGNAADQYAVTLDGELSVNTLLANITAGVRGVSVGSMPTNNTGTTIVGMPSFSATLAATNATAPSNPNTDSIIEPAVPNPANMSATFGVMTVPPENPASTAVPGPSPTDPTSGLSSSSSSNNSDTITKGGVAAVAVTTIICFAVVIGGVVLYHWFKRWRYRRQEEHRHVFASNMSSSVNASAAGPHQRFYDTEDNETDTGLFAPPPGIGNTAAV